MTIPTILMVIVGLLMLSASWLASQSLDTLTGNLIVAVAVIVTAAIVVLSHFFTVKKEDDMEHHLPAH